MVLYGTNYVMQLLNCMVLYLKRHFLILQLDQFLGHLGLLSERSSSLIVMFTVGRDRAHTHPTYSQVCGWSCAQ